MYKPCRYDWFSKNVDGSICIISSPPEQCGSLRKDCSSKLMGQARWCVKRPCLKQGRCQEWSDSCSSSPDFPLPVSCPHFHVYTRVYTHMHRMCGHSFYSNYNHILLNSTLRKTPHRLIKEDNQTLAHWSTLHLSKLLFSARIAISKQWCLLIILLFLHELNCMHLSTTKEERTS